MKYKKVLLYSGITILFIVIVLLVLPFLINLDKYIPKITTPISKKLGREVSIQHLRLTILTGLGVELKGVTVEEKKPTNIPFVHIDDIDVGVKLLPLLKKQISISKVILSKPEINIIRYADGTYNFSDILKQQSEKATAEVTETTRPSSGIPEGFYLDKFEISDGVINITNIEDEKQYRYGLNHINMGVYGFNINNAFRVSLTASLDNIKEARFEINGYIGPTGQHISIEHLPLNLKISLRHIDIPYLFSLGGIKSRILNAGIVDVDEKLDSSSDGTTKIEGKISLSGLTLTNGTISPFSVLNNLQFIPGNKNLDIQNITFKSDGIELGMNGNVNINTKAINLNLVSNQLSIDRVLGFYSPLKKSLPQDMSISGDGIIKTTVNTTNNIIAANGTIDLSKARITYGKTFAKHSGVPMSLSYNVVKDGSKITLNDIKFVLDKLVVNAAGKATLDADMNGGINVSTNSVQIASLEDVIPMIKSYDAKGAFILSADATGPFKKPKALHVHGRLQIKDVSANIKSLPKPLKTLNMDAEFTSNSVNVKYLAVQIGESRLMSNAIITNFSAPEGKLNISSPYVNMDELMPPSSKNKEEQPSGQKGEKKPSILDKADITLSANIRKGIVKKAQFTNLVMLARITKGTIILTRFNTDIFSGMLSANGTVGMNGEEPYDLKLKAASLNLGDMLNTFTSYKDILTGRLAVDLSLNGKAKDLKHTVSGKGIITMTNGEIKTFSMLSNLLSIAKLASIGTDKTTRISNMRLTAAIDHGKVTSNDLKLISNELTVVATGYFDLDSNLNYHGTGIIAKAISNRVGGTGGQLIKNEHGEIEIPFILTGDIRRPVFKLDAQAYEQKLKEAVKKQVIQQLNNQLNRELQNNKAIQQNKAIQEIENKGKKAIEQLFK